MCNCTVFLRRVRAIRLLGPISDLNRLLDDWIWCGSAQIGFLALQGPQWQTLQSKWPIIDNNTDF